MNDKYNFVRLAFLCQLYVSVNGGLGSKGGMQDPWGGLSFQIEHIMEYTLKA